MAREGDQVRLYVDNRTACAYINKQGGTRSCVLAREACAMWEELVDQRINLLTTNWIASKDNCRADFLTRHRFESWEFQLHPTLFSLVVDHFSITPTLDAFASAQTAQLPRYMSWLEDPHAVARDALIAEWDPVTYLFPPVPMLLKVLEKVQQEEIEAILICPHWPAALWWQVAAKLMVTEPLSLPPSKVATLTMEGGPASVFLDPLQALQISGRNTV